MGGLSLWFISVETMAEFKDLVGRATMQEMKEIVQKVLLPLQLSLGVWQIMKLTPLWAVMRCTVTYLLTLLCLPDTHYNKLKGFHGHVFKKVISHATTAGDVSKAKKHKDPNKSKKETKSKNGESISVEYLDKMFEVKKDGNKMSVKDGLAYYITDKMWETVLHIKEVAPETVFLKNHKEIWEEVITGDIMEFEEVLDSVILHNRSVIRLDQDYFLPVNLLRSEDKLLKILNLLGLFLQTQKHVHWLIPALLSFTAAVMGFSTTIRLSIDGLINTVLCKTIQRACDRLPLPMRRRVYFWGNWVENLKPSNDLQSKIVRGDICALVAGGAKADFESLAACESLGNIRALAPKVGKTAEKKVPDWSCFQYLYVPFKHNCAKGRLDIFGDYESLADRSVDRHKTCSKVGPFFFRCDSVYIEWIFDRTHHICSLRAGVFASHEAENLLEPHDLVCDDDDCAREKDIKISTSDSCEVYNHEKGGEYCMSVSGDAYCGAADNKILIADGIDTASVDVDGTSKEAIKLFKFAFYMAEEKSGSLKSYEPDTKTVSVRGFIESINAYARSGYPPLYKLSNNLKNVIVH
ncbi:hypothetical protein SUGI_0096490 [Cryptomeria japonica]|nr:hypothetical protein SUGI_0096490 [Cryptomeria japonica]